MEEALILLQARVKVKSPVGWAKKGVVLECRQNRLVNMGRAAPSWPKGSIRLGEGGRQKDRIHDPGPVWARTLHQKGERS